MKRKVMVVAVGIFILWLIVAVGKQVYLLSKAGKRITFSEQKLFQLEQEQERLKKELAYRQSDEFVEAQARNKLGLVKEGETIAILPKKLQTDRQTQAVAQPEVSNLLRWIQRLF